LEIANGQAVDQSSVYSSLEIEIKEKKKHFKNCAEFVEYVREHDGHSFQLRLFWVQKLKEVSKQLTIKTHKTLAKEYSNSLLTKTENHCTLDDCLKLFTQPEKLTADNPWYCPKCKKHQEAKKQIYLWKLPKYLIVILKRFHAHKEDTSSYPSWMQSKYSNFLQNRLKYEKIHTFIDFPVNNLNMSNYIYDPATQSIESDYGYELYSVINHLGNGLQYGHYTAFARCLDPGDKDNLLGQDFHCWSSYTRCLNRVFFNIKAGVRLTMDV
jgi:ubiquitin C-terminal hydrolase